MLTHWSYVFLALTHQYMVARAYVHLAQWFNASLLWSPIIPVRLLSKIGVSPHNTPEMSHLRVFPHQHVGLLCQVVCFTRWKIIHLYQCCSLEKCVIVTTFHLKWWVSLFQYFKIKLEGSNALQNTIYFNFLAISVGVGGDYGIAVNLTG